MIKQDTVMENEKQIIYLGIDVHLNEWVISFRSAGMHLATHSMVPDPEKLVRYLQKNYPGYRYKSVYEAGFCGFWVHRRLIALGVENIVVNPADIPQMSKEKSGKTDTVDSKKLARELEAGSLSGIYIPTEADESFRSLNRLRYQYVRDMTRQKNRIKAMVHRLGLALPEHHEIRHWSKNFIAYLQNLPFPTPLDKIVMDQLLGVLQNLRDTIAQIIRQLRANVAKDEAATKTVSHLMSVPGVGTITALTLKSELIDMKRFKNLDELCCYVGLIPSVYSSGEKEITRGITNRHLPYLRNLIIESSWVAVRIDTTLLTSYNTLCKRMTKTEAIIRITKKLLNRIMTVWKQQIDYQCQFQTGEQDTDTVRSTPRKKKNLKLIPVGL